MQISFDFRSQKRCRAPLVFLTGTVHSTARINVLSPRRADGSRQEDKAGWRFQAAKNFVI